MLPPPVAHTFFTFTEWMKHNYFPRKYVFAGIQVQLTQSMDALDLLATLGGNIPGRSLPIERLHYAKLFARYVTEISLQYLISMIPRY